MKTQMETKAALENDLREYDFTVRYLEHIDGDYNAKTNYAKREILISSRQAELEQIQLLRDELPYVRRYCLREAASDPSQMVGLEPPPST